MVEWIHEVWQAVRWRLSNMNYMGIWRSKFEKQDFKLEKARVQEVVRKNEEGECAEATEDNVAEKRDKILK